MKQYLKRDIANAKSHDFILGFKIWGRHDIFCAKKGAFCGVYLTDDLPNLYPDDCPDELTCVCVNREFVLRGDGSMEEEQLLENCQKHLQTPTALAVVAVTVAFEEEEPKSENFTFGEVRVLRKLLQVTSPFLWDEKGYWTYETGYPSEELLAQLIERGWAREATLPEKLVKLFTIPKLKEICVLCDLPRTGDKQMLAERIAANEPDKAAELTQGKPISVITDSGKSNIVLQSGFAQAQELKDDYERREQSYQKLVHYARQIEGAKIQINANPWSSCEKLPQIVGVYDPSKSPWLPLGDCPQTRMKPCSCWNASIIEAYPLMREAGTSHEQGLQLTQTEAVPELVPQQEKKKHNFFIRWLGWLLWKLGVF